LQDNLATLRTDRDVLRAELTRSREYKLASKLQSSNGRQPAGSEQWCLHANTEYFRRTTSQKLFKNITPEYRILYQRTLLHTNLQWLTMAFKGNTLGSNATKKEREPPMQRGRGRNIIRGEGAPAIPLVATPRALVVTLLAALEI
jgi:hypothetical protein